MRWVLVIALEIFSMGGYAQNLVKNPSFEHYLECPEELSNFDNQVRDWSIPTQGTTDYFNSCSNVMGTPENFIGTQYPKFGNAYAGLYFYAPEDYREYIQVELKDKLKKDKEYQLEFYVSLAEGSDFAIKDFGVVLGNKLLGVETRKHLSKGRLYQVKGNLYHILEISHSEFNEDKSVWQRIHTTFTAKGFEKYLVLGNFRGNKSIRKIQTKRWETKKGAYYYIDMVSLAPIGKDMSPKNEMGTDILYVLKNVYFDVDQFGLTPEAKEQLVVVRKKMEDKGGMLLEIHGHTDDRGTSAYNQALSKKRAKTIADYFIKAGIPSDRISWYGHGNSKPLVKNNSDEDRAKNRRVEFLFKQAQ